MITVPSQEIAAFLGNHLDHVLQQAGLDFVQSVAAQRHFKAACSLMDVLNSVQSVQRQLQVVLQERHANSNPDRGDPMSEVRTYINFHLSAAEIQTDRQTDKQIVRHERTNYNDDTTFFQIL